MKEDKKILNRLWFVLKNTWISFNNQSLLIKVGFVIAVDSIIIGIILSVLFLQLGKIEKIVFSPYRGHLAASLYVQQRLLETYQNLTSDKKVGTHEIQHILKNMLSGGSISFSVNDSPIFLTLPPLKDNTGRKYIENALHKLKRLSTKEDINKALTELHKFSYWIIKKDLEERTKLLKYLSQTRWIENSLIIILLIALLCGAIAFFLMVLLPLKRITQRIHGIVYTGRTPSDLKLLSFPFTDEIGKLVNEVDNLIKYFDEIEGFKRLLEEENSITDVYERLGRLLRDRFGFQQFVIYAVSNSQNTMKPVYVYPKNVKINQEILIQADLCRAKRTGRTVSSLETPQICKFFLYENAEHICIPLIYGGKIGGVIQIIFPKEATKVQKHILSSLPQLNVFLEESIPVIEAKRFAEGLKNMSIRDQLTGLYNRRFLEQALENIVAGILRRETVLGVLMCDIDFFKKVNDTYGHDVGDEVLKGVAKLLKENVRKADIVARFGGEEFIILLVDIRKGEAIKVAEKLCKIVEDTKFETKAGILRKTISIGVAEFPVDSEGIWQVIKFADVALYKAKQEGRNRAVRFQPKMWTEESY